MSEWDAFPLADKQSSEWDAFPIDQQPSVMADVAKSAGSGLASGAVGLAGLPGDLASALNNYIVNPALKAMGAGEQKPVPAIFGSKDIQDAIEGRTGKFYEPQTTAGKYARTIGEFGPAALIGPGGLVRKAVTQAVIPGVASEAAGQATEGTPIEPFARTGAALLSGGLASMKRAPETGMATDEIKSASSALYQHPDVKAVEIKPQAVVDLHGKIVNDLENNASFRRAFEPKPFNAVDELINPAQTGNVANHAPVSLEQLQKVRSRLGQIAQETDIKGQATADAAAAMRAMGHINEFIPNLKQADLVAGNAQNANTILQQAAQGWRTYKGAALLDRKNYQAELQAARSHSGTNVDNSIRQRLSTILTNPKLKNVYTASEQKQIEQIVRGSMPTNILRRVGNLLGNGVGLGGSLASVAGGSIGASEGGPEGAGVGAILPLIAGAAARRGASALTMRGVRNLDKSIRAKAPFAQLPTTPPLIGPALIRALIANQSSVPFRLSQSSPAVDYSR